MKIRNIIAICFYDVESRPLRHGCGKGYFVKKRIIPWIMISPIVLLYYLLYGIVVGAIELYGSFTKDYYTGTWIEQSYGDQLNNEIKTNYIRRMLDF